MAEAEGVIKFNLSYSERALHEIDIRELNAWRGLLKELALIGQQPDRYDGYGFGNISMKVDDAFLISGTQTGGLETLSLDDYSLCEDWELASNSITACGNVKPSSESLSHAAVYDVQRNANCALHVHSPDLWHNAQALGIVVTDPDVPYGTPEMAQEVRRHIEGMSSPGIFSMGGHEDGIFTYGSTLEEAGVLMIRKLVQARSLA